ncbi:hypothetical protein KV557_00240 [Kitasatospora aureofaciens]|uniref:hypothetical protein n=1 Tax=Kitasatospora aureofaciens TaxID=1894 RepID=UPI001C476D3E|nr:hypothetical protein [Kitasatospora aureofaciens]MBV6695555.1 hypothetical protein [Kitasatospora aureofaciens]
MVKKEALRTRLALGWEPERAIATDKHDQTLPEYTFNGRTMTLRGWAEQIGTTYHTLYNRVVTQDLSIGDALALGPGSARDDKPLTAFGETKPVYMWAVDPRANATATTIYKRIEDGWSARQAITEEPVHRHGLGSGAPWAAFGRRMGLPDWARLSEVPEQTLRNLMDGHSMTLEDALQSMGWLPDWHGRGAQVLQIRAFDLRPGDLVVEAPLPDDGEEQLLTVRRSSAGPGFERAAAAASRSTAIRSVPGSIPRAARLAEPPTRPTSARSL